ncbi:MAG: hypothetical protein ACRYGI_15690 [Janthinobacterium lividum]
MTDDEFPPEGEPFSSEGGLFAPEGGWVVRLLDQSGASDDDIVEEIKGFPTLMQANAFCQAYVRDSVERCRVAGATAREVLASWFAFGEDAEVIDAGESGWRSSGELEDFAATPSTEIERDWRSIDPRGEALDPGHEPDDEDEPDDAEEHDEHGEPDDEAWPLPRHKS